MTSTSLWQGASVVFLLAVSSICQAELVPRLVRDIDPASYAGSSSPRQFSGDDRGMTFTAFGGRELWLYDGREGSLFPILRREEIRLLSGNTYAARDAQGGWTFWDVWGFPYYNVSRASKERVGRLGAVYHDEWPGRGPLVFEAGRGSGYGLWTLSGEIARPLPLENGALLRDWTPQDSKAFFIARHHTLGTALWTTDGTRAGTFPLVAPSPGRTLPLRLAGSLPGGLLLAISGGEPELWRSDGTRRGLRPFLEIVHGRRAATISDARVVDGRAFLVVDDGRHGRQLWTSDGTVAGTYAITSFPPDPLRQIGIPTFAEEGIWYFVADDGIHGRELWRTDGTPQGTRLVVDVCPGSCSSDPRDLGFEYFFTSYGLVFTAAGPEGLRSLWLLADTTQEISRVTPAGVSAMTGISPGGFFAGSDAAFGDEIWLTEGTPETTKLWADLERWQNGGSSAVPLAAAGDRLIFHTSGLTVGHGLWSSDGTAEGTFRLPGPQPAWDIASLGEIAVFLAPPRPALTAPMILWATDGTEGRIVRLTPPGVNALPRLLEAGDQVFFFAEDRAHGTELWRSEGTPESTRLVADLVPGAASVEVNPDALSVLRGQILFHRRDDPLHLWVSDGTAAGTHRLVDADPLLAPLDPWGGMVAELPGKLFFVGAAPGGEGRSLWVSDGTPEGTYPLEVAGRIEQLVPAGSRLFLAVGVAEPEPWGSTQIWVTDGTPAGTARVPTPPLEPLDFEVRPIAFGDRLVFIDEDFHVWITDGSAEGTFPLHDPDGQEIFAFNGSAIGFGKYFVFSPVRTLDPSCYVWDGTGTTALRFENLVCSVFLPVGDRLYFSGDEPETGAELWVFKER